MYICLYPKSIKRKSLESIRNSYKITQDKKRGKKRPRDIKKIMLKSEQIEWFQSVCLCWVDRDREDYREKTHIDARLIHTRKPIERSTHSIREFITFVWFSLFQWFFPLWFMHGLSFVFQHLIEKNHLSIEVQRYQIVQMRYTDSRENMNTKPVWASNTEA